MANIKEVAKKAGVGIATVSRVINKSGSVKRETREKIEKVIDELGYRPNEIARSMTSQKTRLVAFVLPNCYHLFFSELLYYVEQEMSNAGYKVMICNSSEKLEKEIVFLDMLRNNRADAVILLTNNDIEKYLDLRFPIISFDRRFASVPFVASDNFAGGIMAARRLLEKGCKKLLYIGDDAQGDNTPVITEVTKRRKGFLFYLESQGIKDVVSVEYPLGDYFIGPETIREMLMPYPDIDGLFAVSDQVAMSSIKALNMLGKRVPEDVKVIGFDGGRSFLNMGMRLTSISQDPSLIAKAIRDIILSYDKKIKIESRIIPVSLVEGDTA